MNEKVIISPCLESLPYTHLKNLSVGTDITASYGQSIKCHHLSDRFFFSIQLLDITQLLTLKLNHYIKSLATLARSWAKQDARTMNTCAHTSIHCFSVGLKKTEILFSLFLWNVPYDFFSILIFKNRSSALNWCSRIRFFMGFPEMSIVHWFLVVLRKWLNVVIRWWQGILLDWLSQEVIRNIFSFTYIW